MTATIKTDLVGVRQAVASLNKIEPGLRKQFAAELNQIAAPAINEAKARYASAGLPLTGMAKTWSFSYRTLFPYDPSKAAKGVKVKLDTRRNATSVINIVQTDVAANIFETAGRKTNSTFSDNLSTIFGTLPRKGRTRIFGPSVYSRIREVTKEIERATLQVINRVNRDLQ